MRPTPKVPLSEHASSCIGLSRPVDCHGCDADFGNSVRHGWLFRRASTWTLEALSLSDRIDLADFEGLDFRDAAGRVDEEALARALVGHGFSPRPQHTS